MAFHPCRPGAGPILKYSNLLTAMALATMGLVSTVASPSGGLMMGAMARVFTSYPAMLGLGRHGFLGPLSFELDGFSSA